MKRKTLVMEHCSFRPLNRQSLRYMIGDVIWGGTWWGCWDHVPPHEGGTPTTLTYARICTPLQTPSR